MIRGGVRDRNFAFLWSSWVLGIGNSCSSRDHNLEQHRFRKEEVKGESNPALFLLHPQSKVSKYFSKRSHVCDKTLMICCVCFSRSPTPFPPSVLLSSQTLQPSRRCSTTFLACPAASRDSSRIFCGDPLPRLARDSGIAPRSFRPGRPPGSLQCPTASCSYSRPQWHFQVDLRGVVV